MIQDEAQKSIPPATEAVEVPAGLDQQSGNVVLQNTLNQRGGAIQAGIRGAAAGIDASRGSLSPLAAFIQGMSAGMQVPGQIAQEKRKELADTISASPFSVAYPQAYKDIVEKYPGLAWMGGLPAGAIMPAMAAFASEGAKAHASGMEERATKQEEVKLQRPTTPEQVSSYSRLTGLPEGLVKDMRVSALEEYVKTKKEMPGKRSAELEGRRKFFNDMPAVKAWDTIKPNVLTIESLADKLNQKKELTPNDQAQLLIAFKDIITQGGGAARMSEDTLDVVENKGRWSRLVEAITSGAAVTLSPEEARDVINASHVKTNAIKTGYMEERNKFKNILLTDDKEAQDFIFDPRTESPSENISPLPGQLITEEVNGEIIVYRITPDGKGKTRVK